MCCRDTARPWPPGRRLYLHEMSHCKIEEMVLKYQASNKLTETRGARGAMEGVRGVAARGALMLLMLMLRPLEVIASSVRRLQKRTINCDIMDVLQGSSGIRTQKLHLVDLQRSGVCASRHDCQGGIEA
jgi:hypothetical protein